jgi:hypothetical protein
LSSIDSEALFFPLVIGMKVTSRLHFAPASSIAGQLPVVALKSDPAESPSITTGKPILCLVPLGFETLTCRVFDPPTVTEPKLSVLGLIFSLTGTGVSVAVGVGVSVAVAVAVAVAV